MTLLFFSLHPIIQADLTDDELKQKKEEIEQLQAELGRVRGEKQTLSSTITYLNNQISLTQKKIEQTEFQLKVLNTEIEALALEISKLDKSLDDLSKLLIHRINNTYKKSRVSPYMAMFIGADLGEIITRVKYLQESQRNDRQLMFQMETAKLDYDAQKTAKQVKQQELDELSSQLEKQKGSLAVQQNQKRQMLEITNNDERRFQSELAQKMAELEAIQSIIAGKGDEVEVGQVKEGDKIASVIPGASTCSSGAHLHFEVTKDNANRNPADYLRSNTVVWNNSPDGSFGFGGSWRWPLNDTIRITQGYGMTFYASAMRYYGGAPHTGIDMVNNQDYSVLSVKDGTLFRGSIPCRGKPLRYVKVTHADGVNTYYLHVNY